MYVAPEKPPFFRSQPIAILIGFVAAILFFGFMVNLLPVLFRNEVPQMMLSVLTIVIGYLIYKRLHKESTLD